MPVTASSTQSLEQQELLLAGDSAHQGTIRNHVEIKSDLHLRGVLRCACFVPSKSCSVRYKADRFWGLCLLVGPGLVSGTVVYASIHGEQLLFILLYPCSIQAPSTHILTLSRPTNLHAIIAFLLNRCVVYDGNLCCRTSEFRPLIEK